MSGDPLDDLFHGCALAAFLKEARREQGWPDSRATQRLANRLYEDALAEKNAARPGETGGAAGPADGGPVSRHDGG